MFHNAQVKLYIEDGREMSNTTMTRNRDGSVSITFQEYYHLVILKLNQLSRLIM